MKKTIFSKLLLVIFLIGGISATAQVRVKTNRGNNKKKVVVKTNRHNNHNNHNHGKVRVKTNRNRVVVSKPNRPHLGSRVLEMECLLRKLYLAKSKMEKS
jgi:hypothetical protein